MNAVEKALETIVSMWQRIELLQGQAQHDRMTIDQTTKALHDMGAEYRKLADIEQMYKRQSVEMEDLRKRAQAEATAAKEARAETQKAAAIYSEEVAKVIRERDGWHDAHLAMSDRLGQLEQDYGQVVVERDEAIAQCTECRNNWSSQVNHLTEQRDEAIRQLRIVTSDRDKATRQLETLRENNAGRIGE